MRRKVSNRRNAGSRAPSPGQGEANPVDNSASAKSLPDETPTALNELAHAAEALRLQREILAHTRRATEAILARTRSLQEKMHWIVQQAADQEQEYEGAHAPDAGLAQHIRAPMSPRAVTGLSRNELLAHLQAAHVRTEKAADLILRLQAITAALAKARTPDQVAAVIVEWGVQALEVPAAFVALLSDDGTGVKLAHAAGVPEEVHNRWRHFALSTPTAVTRAIRTGAPNFPATESQASGEDPLLADVQTHLPDSVWTVLPLGAGQRVIGALTFILSRWRWLVDDERSFALNVAQIGAQAFERARLQEREIRTWAESERLQKTLLNAIAHDLKTPLTTVQGCLDTLLIDDERLEPPTRRELLTIAHQGVRRFSRVVTGVLQMRRLETGAVQLRRESGILGEVVQNAVDEVASTPDRSRYNIDLPDNLPLIPMDTLLMSHVLINLLENAAKYSPPESRIDVGTHLENDSVVISVADQGTGSSPEQLNRVFESSGDPVEHFTTRAEGGGLGLIIAREFVEAHNGRIWATHREGGGMVVNVSIPLHGSHPSSSNAL